MKINYGGPINHTGYGIASFNILKELSKIIDTTLLPIGSPYVNNQEDYDFVLSLINKKQTCNISSPYIKIWHQFDLFEHFGKGNFYAFPFFELDTFNEYEKNSMRVPDHFFVTSEWAKQVLVTNGIDQEIDIIPLGVDRKIFNESIKNNKQITNTYKFINIGKWEIRKGHDILIKLFNTAFPEEKDVELILVASESTSSYSSKQELDQWKNMYNSPRITIIPGVNTQQDIAQIIANCDCGIFPSRAEGWNLEALETLSMGKPIIITNYSGHTEFCNKDNSYLVDIRNTEKAFDGKAFLGQGNWAKIDEIAFDQIIDYMRYVYKNKITTNNQGIITAKSFSWERSAKAIAGCIY